MSSQLVVLLIVGIFAGANAISEDDQNTVVNVHNSYRGSVQPPAMNMKRMTWHNGAARMAQDWANACERLTHNNPYDGQYGTCGQNILVSTNPMQWNFVVQNWYDEVSQFTYGGGNPDLNAIGHYTQVVWADSHKVGCGVAHCYDAVHGFYYNYVCNYCPTGNYQHQLSRPYKKGNRCGSCPDSCQNGLCS